jgi:hypothetical protein
MHRATSDDFWHAQILKKINTEPADTKKNPDFLSVNPSIKNIDNRSKSINLSNVFQEERSFLNSRSDEGVDVCVYKNLDRSRDLEREDDDEDDEDEEDDDLRLFFCFRSRLLRFLEGEQKEVVVALNDDHCFIGILTNDTHFFKRYPV